MNERGVVRVHLVVCGRVQGVGFRYATAREARRVGVTGWVRNTPDGRVQIVAEGAVDAVEQFVRWTRSGPPAAHVTDVQRTDMESHSPPFKDFRIQ